MIGQLLHAASLIFYKAFVRVYSAQRVGSVKVQGH